MLACSLGAPPKTLGRQVSLFRGLIRDQEREGRGGASVQMAVKVDDGDGAVFAVDGAEEGESDGVVTSKGDHTRECFAMLRRTGLVGVGVGSAAQEEVVALLDLLERVRIVVPEHHHLISTFMSKFQNHRNRNNLRGNRNVTAVNDLCP